MAGEGLIRREDLHDTMLGTWDTIPQLVNPNLVINGDFQVWQRGASVTVNNGVHYTADRWAMWNGTGNTTIANATNNASWYTGGNDNLVQIVELPASAMSRDLTMSCIITAPTGVTVAVHCAGATNATTADAGVGVNYVGKGIWEKVKLSIPASVNNKKLFMVHFGCGVAGTTIGITNVKLEIGTVATPFIPRSYAEELALCQRYYEIVRYVGRVATGMKEMIGSIEYKVTKRSNPVRKDIGSSVYDSVSGWITKVPLLDGYPNNENCHFNISSTNSIVDVQVNAVADAEIY